MKSLNIIVNPYSHAMFRLIERLNIKEPSEKMIEQLNEKFSSGIYNSKRRRVYIPPLGYFGIERHGKYKGKYFAATFYRGLPPSSLKEINVHVHWFLGEGLEEE